MSYYTIVDRCPQCNELQKRWIIENFETEDTVTCVNCLETFSSDSAAFQIELTDNSFSYSKTLTF